MQRRKGALALGTIMILLLTATAIAQAGHNLGSSSGQRPAGSLLRKLLINEPVEAAGGVLPGDEQGPVQLFVEFSDPSLSDVWLATGGEQQAATILSLQKYAEEMAERQASAAAAVNALDGEVLAHYTNVFNGLAVKIEAGRIEQLSRIPGVKSIEAAVDYEVTLNNTVPWVGAAAVQNAGYDGSGIRVAVVDTGIDYTHAHLGGSGSQADTNKAISEASSPADPALYPSSKVIGGYDFIGSRWDGGSFTTLEPDSNPMDDNGGSPNGHGTHVASILGGVDTSSSGGIGPGVAPGVAFYALKVCSSVSASCSAVAIRQAFDWAADPNGDNNFADRADVMNLSLGASYGQTGDQDLAIMDRLSSLGMIIAAAAGNGGDAPYVLSSPARAQSVISVAQTSPAPAASTVSRDGLLAVTGDQTTESIVFSSSRGPTFDSNMAKPEIGAPGTSVSASSGNQAYGGFGGTSGSTPVVAGAVALLLDANNGPGSLNWAEAKALLMNNAFTEVRNGPSTNSLAPISRQGAGRLDVKSAVDAEAFAYDADSKQAAISFGLGAVSSPYSATRKILVENTSAQSKQFDVTTTFRYANDSALGVSVTPSVNMITVPAGGSTTFDLNLLVSGPDLLPPYYDLLAGGRNLIDGSKLTTAEVDGFVTLKNGNETLNLPFHFLPRQAAALAVDTNTLDVPVAPGKASLEISNGSTISGIVETYQLFDISPRLNQAALADEQQVDLQYVGADVAIDVFDGHPDFDDHNLYFFAISTYEMRSHPVNVRYYVSVDLDQDGQDDWIIYNIMTNTGVSISAQYNLADDSAHSYFVLDTALNSNNMVLYFLLPDAADPDLKFDFRVIAFDAYFGTPLRKSDESPLGGGYHRHDVHNPRFVTDTFYEEIAPQASINPTFQAKLSESTQIGYMYRFYNGVQETTAVKMAASGFSYAHLPVVRSAD